MNACLDWCCFLTSHIAGCFSKDQVYLDGILSILRYRDKINFPLLMALGKVEYLIVYLCCSVYIKLDTLFLLSKTMKLFCNPVTCLVWCPQS